MVLPALQAGAALPGEVFTDLLETLERQNIARVLDSPTLLLTDRRSGSFVNGGQIAVPKPGGKPGECVMQEVGTRIDARAMLLDENRVRIEVRPRVAHLLSTGEHGPNVCVRELDAGFDTEFGKTVVLGGLPQERMLKEKDPKTLEDRQVHDVRETYFLVTPYAVDKPAAVQPASHAEPVAH
jgi:type II secretory pathway component GspD/PulD (secretin)